MLSRLAPALLLLLPASLFAACDLQPHAAAGTPVAVVTSFPLFSDLVRQVGGSRVSVTALVPNGVDPHTYQPVPKEVGKVERARLEVVNGLGLDRTVEDLMKANGSGTLLRLSDAVPADQVVDDNPHLWMDPTYAIRYVESIRDGLIAVDPEGAADYTANAAAYVGQLQALDSEIRSAISTIPADRRKIVTYHDAFPYFARRYGLEIVGVVLKGPGREASAKDVADLSKELQSGGVPAAYREPQFSSKVLDLAAADAGVRVLELYSDAFDSRIQSYVDLMRFDAAQLVEGLA